MKVYFFESDTEDQVTLRELISENATLKAAGVESLFVTEPLNAATVDQAVDADIVSTFTHCFVDAPVLAKLPKVKFITPRSTGFDNIDLAKAAAQGIVVSNVPAYGSRTVAEYAFSLILGLTRKTFAATAQIKNRQDFSIAGFEGFNLQGKTIGILGTGRIGLNAAMIAKGFDMKILGFDPYPNTKAAGDIGFTYVDLDTLLASADIVTVHVPLMDSTRHLLNDAAFSKMKKGVILVNTSRGEVVDTEALIRALDAKIVGAAGLDVIEGERDIVDEWSFLAHQKDHPEQSVKTLLEDHALMNHPEVFITPHIAFFSKEAKREILQTTVANIEAFVKNAPVNVVKAS